MVHNVKDDNADDYHHHHHQLHFEFIFWPILPGYSRLGWVPKFWELLEADF